MAHFHEMPDGTKTSVEVVVPGSPELHFHNIDGQETSIDPFGPEHIHTLDGVDTSGPIEQNEKHMTTEHVTLQFKASETKQIEEAGNNIGVFAGHLAAFAKDRGNDVFLPGAFLESIKRHQDEGRPIRMLFGHNDELLIGGFPAETVKEDAKGLFVVGNINLDVQKGKEAFALMKQGVLTDMSIGFAIMSRDDVDFKDDIRFIKKVEIFEGSLVPEPMNVAAQVTEIKSVVPFQDLPLADQARPWDSPEALARVREFTNSAEAPSAEYRRAFLWYDRENADQFGAYKLPIADVVDGSLTAIPRGIFAAAAALLGARGGVDILEEDMQAVINNVERYYAKMDLDSPFDKKSYVADDVNAWTERDLEKFLKDTGMMSKSAAKALVSRCNIKKAEAEEQEAPDYTEIMNEIKAIQGLIKSKS